MSGSRAASIEDESMKPSARPATLAFALVSAVASLVGCAEPPRPEPAALRAPADIGRDRAVYMAAFDAQSSFGVYGPTPVFVNRTGEIWVVEMSSADGAQLHYAIGAFDGTVRERHIRR